MKKTILIGLIGTVCILVILIAVGGVAGDVTFGPDILKTTLGGKEGYFVMGAEENR